MPEQIPVIQRPPNSCTSLFANLRGTTRQLEARKYLIFSFKQPLNSVHLVSKRHFLLSTMKTNKCLTYE